MSTEKKEDVVSAVKAPTGESSATIPQKSQTVTNPISTPTTSPTPSAPISPNKTPGVNVPENHMILPIQEYNDLMERAKKSLIPEGYMLIKEEIFEKLMDRVSQPTALSSTPNIIINQEKEPVKPFFHILFLRQMLMGDINRNFSRGDEVEYTPGEFLKVGGEKLKTIKSFAKQFERQYGRKPDPDLIARPIFQILNPETCPSIEASIGKYGTPRFANDEQRILYEEKRGDAGHPAYISGLTQTPQAVLEPREGNQERVVSHRDPFVNYNNRDSFQKNEVDPVTGRTAKAEMIHQMKADEIERHDGMVQQPPRPEPKSVSDFKVNPGMMAGGPVVARIPGKPADEPAAMAKAAGKDPGIRSYSANG